MTTHINGQLRLSLAQSSQGPDYWTLRAIDEDSHTGVFEVRIPEEMISKLLSNQQADVDIEVFDQNADRHWGRVVEATSVVIPGLWKTWMETEVITSVESAENAIHAFIAASPTEDGWTSFDSVDLGLFQGKLNHYRKVGDNDYRVILTRYVPKEDSDAQASA